MRRTLSQSYIAHALVGGALAVPVMLLAFYAAIFIAAVLDAALAKAAPDLMIGIFWTMVVLVPAGMAALLYRLRQWLAGERPRLYGYAAYALPGATSGFATIGLTLLLGRTSPFGSATMIVTAIVVGVVAGWSCLFLERRMSDRVSASCPSR